MSEQRSPPVSFVTVTHDAYLFARLLIEKIREFVGNRDYEIVVVDRGSGRQLRAWLRAQPDVRVITLRQWRRRGHGHGEAGEAGAAAARHQRIVLLDSDAHPIAADWLRETADKLDAQHRLAGAVFGGRHRGNPHGWYVHPHFMAFFKADLNRLIVLRKLRGDDTDTGEEATIRVLAAGHRIIGLPIAHYPPLSVGNPRVPTVAGGVFHAWYVTRLEQNEPEVVRETAGEITGANYLEPLKAKLRAIYRLSY
ncbi:MAG: glycosyltransferase [Alphaproteobacteria bacterium]|nr:glycosyltransferase [Alphaproteobacteria bacterium]